MAHTEDNTSMEEFRLTDEQVQTFLDDGVLVAPLFTEDEMAQARHEFHEYLRNFGVDHENWETTAHKLPGMTGGLGGFVECYYQNFKLKLHGDRRMMTAMSQLWGASYASGKTPGYENPFGPFDHEKGYMYVDRCGYRIPTQAAVELGKENNDPIQKSVGPHVDCCPSDLYGTDGRKGEMRRFRPIQSFISLTDNLEPNTGGFEAVPGFHKRFDEYFMDTKRYKTVVTKGGDQVDLEQKPICFGDFSPLAIEGDPYRSVIDRYQHIPVRAGCAVFWDQRVPHCNAELHAGTRPREVIYTGHLPDCELNRSYAKEQVRCIEANCLPPEHGGLQQFPANEFDHFPSGDALSELPELVKKQLGLTPWGPNKPVCVLM
eukprot:GFYU01001530.1.p1 GENE.GFYU01001530.1~~GFYU01001530.1.p1  ORF type:complete len:389 (-),score=64.04 GFYU01001530.1:98-1219(-)